MIHTPYTVRSTQSCHHTTLSYPHILISLYPILSHSLICFVCLTAWPPCTSLATKRSATCVSLPPPFPLHNRMTVWFWEVGWVFLCYSLQPFLVLSSSFTPCFSHSTILSTPFSCTIPSSFTPRFSHYSIGRGDFISCCSGWVVFLHLCSGQQQLSSWPQNPHLWCLWHDHWHCADPLGPLTHTIQTHPMQHGALCQRIFLLSCCGSCHSCCCFW